MTKKFITSVLTMALFALFAVATTAQEDKSNRPSPPATATGTIGGTSVSVDYSQVGVKDRKIWGALVPYGKVWRTGANEATVLESSSDLNINGKTLPAGKYGVFTIPNEDKWTVIFNSDWEQWGAYNYDKGKDVLRVDLTPQQSDQFVERLSFYVDESGIKLMWENLMLLIPAKAKA